MDVTNKEFFRRKIKTVDQILDILGPFPRKEKVIMCHGTFDIVHPGHIRHLLYAKSKGDILVVSITGDVHVTKDNYRPYVPEDLRQLNLAALEFVDYVITDFDATPLNNLRLLKPDFFAKGYEYVEGTVHPKTQEEIDVLESYGGEIIFTPGDIVYSSSALINLEPPGIELEKLMTLMEREKITFEDLRKTLKNFSNISVHVVGDTIVDSYTHCVPIGGMTKTPTMSMRYEKRLDFVGGAAIVAKHLKAAGAQVSFSTVLGQDPLAEFVLNDLKAYGIQCLDVVDSTRSTTNKNAIVANGYRLLKIDTVDNRSISDRILQLLVNNIQSTAANIVVFSDFRHGMFNKTSIPDLTAAIPEECFRVADSQVASRWGNILDFQGFDLITPNEREARFSLGDQDSVVRNLALDLIAQAKCKTLILKMGEKGSLTCRNLPKEDPRSFFSVDSFSEHVVDAVGSGDALLSYATLSLYVSKNEAISSILGSLAAAVECEYDGNIPVTPEHVLKKIDRLEKKANFNY
jgi:rfaE bifunctional protein kinase chain/domain